MISVLQAALMYGARVKARLTSPLAPGEPLGFGPAEVVALPSIEAQQLAARWVGMHQLQLDHVNSKALKTADEVYVDMSALAKGLGVDEVADSLAAAACTDYMVDIGGEIRLAGRNARLVLADWR